MFGHVVANLLPLEGTSEGPVQIDESYFRCRLKYNRGRLLNGNRTNSSKVEMQELESTDEEYYDDNRPIIGQTSMDNPIMGSWVLGLYRSKTEKRFVYIPDRSSATLIPIRQRVVAEGSVISTDEWRAYRRLRDLQYTHQAVNHCENFVDPITGHTRKEFRGLGRKKRPD